MERGGREGEREGGREGGRERERGGGLLLVDIVFRGRERGDVRFG